MATRCDDSSGGATCPRYVMYQSSRVYSSAGEYPAVCMTEKLAIAVNTGYYHSGTLFYRLGNIDGKTIDWSKTDNKINLAGSCSFPSVAVTSEGVVLLAYVKNRNTCYYTVGAVAEDEIKWSHSTLIDDGKKLSISIHTGEDNTLTVVVAFVSAANRGYTRVGNLEATGKTIRWKGEKQEICGDPNFKEVSIAISPNKEIVVAYRLAFMKIICQIGKIEPTTGNDHNQQIEFSSKDIANFHGFHPSVTINKQGHVLMFHQSIAGRKLMCLCGVLQPGGLITWKERRAEHIDYGCYPDVSLLDSGIFIELHGTNFGTSLYYRIGEIQA